MFCQVELHLINKNLLKKNLGQRIMNNGTLNQTKLERIVSKAHMLVINVCEISALNVSYYSGYIASFTMNVQTLFILSNSTKHQWYQ